MSQSTVNTFLLLACMVYSCSMLTLPLTGGQANLLENSTVHSKINHVDNTVANPSCGQVRSFFLQQQIAPEEQLPQSAITDGSLSVCESRETCCTPSMETALQISASRNFGYALRVSSDHLRASLTDAASSIQGQIVHHIQGSMKKTQTMFTELYKRVALLAREPIVNLFTELERFILSKDDQANVDIAASVARFFADLFPRLYGQSPSTVQGPPVMAGRTTVRDLSPDDVECLRKAQAELRPFGEIPRRLASSLARTLDAAKALLSSLHLGVEVLNATDHSEMNGECSAALLRASYCAQCRGYSSVQLCRGLCSNVVRGCLAAVADVDQPWNEWVEAMERLTNAIMNGDLGTHDILSSIDSRLSEGIIYALENGPILEKKVKRICGEMNSNSTKEGSTSQEGFLVADETVLEDSKDLSVMQNESALGDLTSRLQALHPILASARGFYANLPDTICTTKSSPLASEEDSNCWNGQRLGEYTKPISGIGIGAQKYNAEVKVSRSDLDPSLLQLSDKLRHVRQVLISKTVVAPEPDSLVMADFGSGSGDSGLSKEPVWIPDDNEGGTVDDNQGSSYDGSGSGSGPYRPPLIMDATSTTQTSVETTPKSSSSSTLTSALALALSLALVLSARHFA